MPAARVRYLGEVAETVHAYRGEAERQIELARRAQQLTAGAAAAEESGHAAAAAELDQLAAAARSGLSARAQELLDAWPSTSRIVCGDFNAEPESEVLSAATERGLVDAFASMPRAFTCNANGQKKRIDYILHTPNYASTPVAPARVDDDTPLPSDEEPSDHVAIEARLDP